MKILKTVKKIPGGLMVIPLLLGAAFNTWLPGLITIGGAGTFTTYLWKSGAMPILAVFLFCNDDRHLNNIAVLLSESGCDADAVVENLLKEADEKGCVAASYNLGLFCLTHKRKAEAQKWLQKALKRESELRNSLLLE